MTSQTVKFALARLARFDAVRVYSYSGYTHIKFGFWPVKRAGVYKVGK
jgi:hypothetical protein